jgi:diguanylate cyclase (GGDEF)-like protein
MQSGKTEITSRLEFDGLEVNKRPYLVIMSGQNIGHRYPLVSHKKIFIGRLYSADILLNEPNVSRRHAHIGIKPEGIILTDLDSTNGTYVNGEKISCCALQDGDLIIIGKTILKFSYQSEVDNAFYEEIIDSARFDALTGLATRKFFNGYLKSEYARIERYGGSVSLLLCDLDNFKKVNDAHGHQAGDLVLSMVGSAIRSSIRQNVDIAGRYGGEEIVILLPEIDLTMARIVGEKVRSEIENLTFKYKSVDLKITISIGISASSDVIDTPEKLINTADSQLYLAKNKGKNRVEYGDS